MRSQQGVGQLAASHRIGSEDGVGAGATELFASLLFGNARCHDDVGIERFRRKNDEEVLGIGGKCRNQSLCAEHAGFAKAIIASRVGDDGEHPGEHGLFNPLFIAVDDQERHACTLEFIRGVAAYAAEAAHDEVVVQVMDHTFHPALAVAVLQFKFDDGLGHRADGKKHGAHSKQNQKRIKDAGRRG